MWNTWPIAQSFCAARWRGDESLFRNARVYDPDLPPGRRAFAPPAIGKSLQDRDEAGLLEVTIADERFADSSLLHDYE